MANNDDGCGAVLAWLAIAFAVGAVIGCGFGVVAGLIVGGGM